MKITERQLRQIIRETIYRHASRKLFEIYDRDEGDMDWVYDYGLEDLNTVLRDLGRGDSKWSKGGQEMLRNEVLNRMVNIIGGLECSYDSEGQDDQSMRFVLSGNSGDETVEFSVSVSPPMETDGSGHYSGGIANKFIKLFNFSREDLMSGPAEGLHDMIKEKILDVISESELKALEKELEGNR